MDSTQRLMLECGYSAQKCPETHFGMKNLSVRIPFFFFYKQKPLNLLNKIFSLTTMGSQIAARLVTHARPPPQISAIV
uniref:Uncharacterized protein n=1 Tax=Anguilla anguilla TaxID=7936 RepID=A0A0E9UY97_ANGAN